MSAPAPGRAPGSEAPLACHTDPDQWFDPAARTQSLAACLGCPHRRWCARRALNYRPSAGMWAGVWIDGRFAAVAADFEAIAADTLLPRPSTPEATPPAPNPAAAPAFPVGVGCTAASRVAPQALVWARSSGHCEIMATGCGLSASTVASRIPGRAGGSADTLYAVCRPCASVLDELDPQIAGRLGYQVDRTAQAGATPFFWRQTHRLMLSTDGALYAVADGETRPERSADLPR